MIRSLSILFCLHLAVGGCENSTDSPAPEPEPDVIEGLCSSDSDCSDGEVCDPYLNEGQGGCAVCIADLSVCEGSKVKTCLPDGSGFADPVECIPADPCMVSEGCVDGACGEVTPKSCDDGDDCTADQCNGITGECVSLPGPFPGCCASDEDCDDGLSCTTDTCDTLNGICSNPGGPCFDEVFAWGEKGSENGQLKFPAAVAVLPDSTVIVADTGNNRLSAFSETGEYLFAIDPALPDVDQCLTPAEAGGCGLSGPTGMDVLQDGRLVVADTGNDRVLIYEADWSSVTALLGGGNLQGPSDVAVERDAENTETIWVANFSGQNVIQLSLEDEVLRTVGEKGDSPGKFRKAFAVETDGNGNILVSDRELNRIQLIDPVSEDALIVFGDTGAGQGQFKQAGGLARTWRGDILVADSENARLQSLSQCTPSCSEEFNCGSNGCGGLCGVCFGDAQCIDGRCVDAFDGGAGCTGGTTPGCDGCECETCVCDLDPFCCETAFDNNCVGACVLECGGGCPDPGIAPELEPTMVYQATIGESDGNTFIQPTELFIDGSNRVWVIDSVSTKIKAFQLTP